MSITIPLSNTYTSAENCPCVCCNSLLCFEDKLIHPWCSAAVFG